MGKKSCFCKAPWVHLENDPSGVFMPCCTYFSSLGKVENGWKEAWNGREMQALRKGFLEFDPQYTNPCKHCIAYERFGLSQRNIMDYLWESVGCPELTEVVSTVPVFLDLRFSTTCNFACVMCGPHASSRWSQELGMKPLRFSCSELVNLVKDCLPSLKHIHFAGGEPLIIREHREILDLLVNSNKFNVELTYNTNLSSVFIDNWKQFENVGISISLDAIGSKNDYIRFGGNWENLQQNIQKLLEHPNIRLSFHPTFTILNVTEALVIRRYAESLGIPVVWGNFAEGPEYLDIRNFPKEIREAVLGLLDPQSREEEEFVEIIRNQVNSGKESEGVVDRCHKNLEVLDKRRGTNWKTEFPELYRILK